MTPARHEAINPRTEPTRLEQLARITELAPHVAANPNTPVHTLYDLARHHPDPVLNNTSFQLEIAINPATLDHIPKDALQQLALRDNAPTTLIDHYRRTATLREQTSLTRRADTNAQAILDKHKRNSTHRHTPDPDTTTLQAHTSLKPHAETPPAPLEVIADLAGGDASWLASPSLAPAELLEAIAEKHWGSGEPLTRIAANPAAPKHLLRRLLDHPDASTRRAAAMHPNLPATDLRDAARQATSQGDDDHAVSLMTNLARRPDVDARDITWLVNWTLRHKRGQVGALLYAASNPNTPQKTLRALHQLGRDTSNSALLEEVATNPHLPHDLAHDLAKGVNTVRRALARDASRLPPDVQERLVLDPDPMVRDAAIATTNLHDHLTKSAQAPIILVRENTAKNPNLALELIEQLRNDPERTVRNIIHAHPKNPPRGHWGGELDESIVRDAACRGLSQSQGKELLEALRRALHTHPDHANAQRAAQALAQNPNQPATTRLEAATILRAQLTQHPAKKLHDHATTPNHKTLAIAQANADTGSQAAHAHTLPASDLEGWAGRQLAHHGDWRVRAVLASRPDLPKTLRDVLEHDGDTRVKAALGRQVPTHA